MTAPQADGADRYSRAAQGPLRASAAAPALAILLLLGFVLRLTIAYVLWPGSGFESDIGTYTYWANRLHEVGPGGFYAPDVFADYPPAYLYVLWLGSHIVAPFTGGDLGQASSDLLKLPPMLADIGLAYVLYRLVRSWAGERPDGERLGLLAAGLYLFNPVTWYDSALWGQTDPVGTLVIVLGVAALVRGNSEGAAVLAVLAGLVKPQFGIVLAPVVAAVLLRRHLLAPGSGPRNRPWVPVRLRPWFETEQGPFRLVTAAAAGLVTLLVAITPFGLGVPEFLERMAATAGGYAWLSVNAYNPWALLGAGGQAPLAFGGGWSPDTVPLIGPIPGLAIGALLLAGCFLLGMLRAAWLDDRRSIVVVTIFLALAFFVVPTRVHERYLFPVFGLLPLLAVVDRRWLAVMLALSIGTFINFHGVLTTPLYATPNLEGLPLGEFFRTPGPIILSAAIAAAGLLYTLWRLRPAVARAADPYDLPDDLPLPAGRATITTERPRGRGGPGLGWQGADLTRRLRRALAALVASVPVRRDRSAELAGESGGRLDRLDLLLLIVVLLATLGLRTFRLEKPYGMYFDEVYHARTATEFLQHWRYDMPHSIYEYTHPHLAKYLMAAGIVALGNNRVVAEMDVGADVAAAAIERRWSSEESSARRNGDRLYLATDDGVRVQDLANGREETIIPLRAQAMAVDDDSHVLYLGDSAGGLWRLSTEALDALRSGDGSADGLSPAPVASLSGLAGELSWLGVSGGRLVVISAGGTVASVDPASGIERGRTTLPGASEALALSGVETETGEALAVASEAGIAILDAETLDELTLLATSEPVTGLALVERGLDRPTIYAAAGSVLQTVRLPEDGPPELGQRVSMPNSVRDTIWNPSTGLLHVLGTAQDGSGATIYVLVPVANSIFADARLAFEPAAVLLDAQPLRPADERAVLLAIDAGGRVATVDAGSNAFGWRLPGVVAGALMAACIYLLGRFLFSRRSVAVIASLLVLADGMFFANARIAMNDSYVALFIVAAFTLFVPLWLGRWRARWAVPVGLLGVGVLLGLALASKWVGAYAIGAIGLLILVRSALGRLVALAGMVLLTGVLGYVAVTAAPEAVNPQLNFLFLLLMLSLTVALAVLMTLRPVRMTLDELRLLIVWPAAAGAALLVAAAGLALAVEQTPGAALLTPTRLAIAGAVLLAIGGASYGLARLAAGLGHGPLATAEPAEPGTEPAGPPPARGWLRPGSGPLGLPWLAALAAISVIPLIVYVVSFVPWIELGNRWWAGFPGDHAGQTFLELQASMYDYHNDLRATHAASSPWWAWPFDLKPVWFYREQFAQATTGQIYDAGNLVAFWLAVPALGFVAFQAWRRRSLPLTALVVAVACLWLPWARIDRVAFQYHIFTSLPFVFLGLAYFLAELWHGPSPRTWLLARLAAALAIVAPAVLWLLRLPLCGIARTEQVNPGTEVCGALARRLVLSDVQLLGLLAALAALVLVGWLLWLNAGPDARSAARRRPALAFVFGLAIAGALLVLIGAALPGRPVFEHDVRAEEPAFVALLLLSLPAYFVLRARDARRFVIGVLAAVTIWFVVWYPNIAALPVPAALSELYQGLLPTWNYAFQFGSNQDAPSRAGLDAGGVAVLLLLTAVLVVAAIHVARARRAEQAEERLLDALHETGSASAERAPLS